MNLLKIIEEVEKVDPELPERLNPRRAAIKNITGFGSKIAIASLPLVFTTLFKKAYGATLPNAVADVLNFALKLEYLEAYLYNQALATPGLVVDNQYIAFIANDENRHVSFLQAALGSAAIESPRFDLTAKGAFPNVLKNYDSFLAVANGLEDTGVRAYKGQLNSVILSDSTLTILTIHAVEARHAAAIRELRKSRGVNIDPWITGTATTANDTGVAAFNANYAGENNVTQLGIDLTTLPSVYGSTTPYHVAAEAFDEPLDTAAILNLLNPFFA